MTLASKKQIGLIKSLQSTRDLGDGEYRQLLIALTNKDSAKKLTVSEASRVIEHLKGGESEPTPHNRRYRQKSDKPYVRRIYVVWRLLKDAGVVGDGLNPFVKSQLGVDNVEWLTLEQGRKFNQTLKAMADRNGVNIDR